MIDFDIEKNQEALRDLYIAIQTHQKFWAIWLSDRVGPNDELQAANALGEALKNIADLEEAMLKNCYRC